MGSAAGCAGRTEKRLPGESDPEQRQAGHLGVHPALYPAGRTSDCSFPAGTAAGGSHPTGDAWLLCQIKKIWHEENKNVLIYLDVSSILFSVGISGGVCHREQ